MVLKMLGAAVSAFLPKQYLVHILVGITTILAIRAFSQGRKTNRERDLHGRIILLTGGFTPLGLTLLQSLAQRGAHIIALSPHPIESPKVSILITLLRSTTSNEQIFAEQCDLASPSSIHSFCTRFLTGQDQRLDALVFAHEYQHIGSFGFLSRKQDSGSEDAKAREEGSLATFLMTTLLLPALLVAPVERDIRVVNVVNPFYAAAIGPSFSLSFPSSSVTSTPKPQSKSIFLHEGTRSLRTTILTRHLQRILDALPAAQVPKTDDSTSTIPVVSAKAQKSNIVAVSVSPGISRVDTTARLLDADWTISAGYSTLGVLLYLILQPFLRVLTKTPEAAMQSVLHVLFLPTPFKVLSRAVPKTSRDKAKGKGTPIDDSVTEMPEEVLKPGALYSDCAVVHLKVPALATEDVGQGTAGEEKRKGKQRATGKEGRDGLDLPEDGELGGELTGRVVWEAFEEALKAWEKANPPVEEEKKEAPDIDRDSLPGEAGGSAL